MLDLLTEDWNHQLQNFKGSISRDLLGHSPSLDQVAQVQVTCNLIIQRLLRSISGHSI